MPKIEREGFTVATIYLPPDDRSWRIEQNGLAGIRVGFAGLGTVNFAKFSDFARFAELCRTYCEDTARTMVADAVANE